MAGVEEPIVAPPEEPPAETEPPAPFVSNDSAFAFVSNLLDAASAHLAAGGTAFPFDLPSGFAGFDTPAGFTAFNRALKARVEVYRGSRGCGNPCYTTALTALGLSFVDTSEAATLNRGVYFNFGTGPGDLANFLAQDPQTSDNFVHPSLEDSAETQTGGGLDARLLAKTVARTPRTVSGLTGDRSFTTYPTPGAPISIVRNEELILLRAEANNGLNNGAASAADINYIRVQSGGLALDSYERAVSSKRAADLADQHQRVMERARQLQREVRDLAEAAWNAGLTDPEWQRQLRELEALLERAVTPELERRLRALREALERLDPEAMREALRQLAEAGRELREELARSRELFERAAIEGSLTTLATDAEELAALMREIGFADVEFERMTGGIVVGGWEFVWAAYGVTAAVLITYGISLASRLREAKRNSNERD